VGASSLDKGVEGGASLYVRKAGGLRIEEGPEACRYYYLGELAPGDMVVGAEGAVCVPTNYAVGEGGLNHLIEPVGGGDIGEGWDPGSLQLPAFAQDYHLDYLGAGGGVEGTEGVVGIAGDDATADEPVNSSVEVLVGVDVGERDAG